MGKLNFTWSARPNFTVNKASNFTFALAKTSLRKPKKNLLLFQQVFTFLKVYNPL
jgi:hypothetical protein